MIAGEIRPIAICVFEHQGRLFVAEGYDSVKKETFYRPLGGAIEFGELGSDCIVRELQEEMNTKIENVNYIGVIENVFTYNGETGHEIVLVFEAEFSDRKFYGTESIKLQDNGDWFLAMWKPVDYFRAGKAPLYPSGLLDLLEKKRNKPLF
jgi:ADP-ribose pyrophosphatase YjhB (NUDIX family)